MCFIKIEKFFLDPLHSVRGYRKRKMYGRLNRSVPVVFQKPNMKGVTVQFNVDLGELGTDPTGSS